jgi:hypothetical protein
MAIVAFGLALALAFASPALAQTDEPGDTGPDGPLHIEDLLCPLSPRGTEGCITQGFHAGHRGIDISLWGGTTISATHAGTVACGGWVGGHFGNLIIVRSEGDPPEWESWYGHLDQVLVGQGEAVARGQLIGLSGNTGEKTTGAHLHYEIHHFGVPVDPLSLPEETSEGTPSPGIPQEEEQMLTATPPADVNAEGGQGAEGSADPAPSAWTVTGGVAVAVLLIGLALSAFGSLTQALAVRALGRTYRRHKAREMELALGQSLAAYSEQVRERLAADPDAWRGVVRQLLTDAGVDGDATLAEVVDVSADPCPHFAIAGVNGRPQYLFATDPGVLRSGGIVHRRDRVVALDVALSPFARVEAQTLWDRLARGRLRGKPPALSREAAWWLVVRGGTERIPQARGKGRWRWPWGGRGR